MEGLSKLRVEVSKVCNCRQKGECRCGVAWKGCQNGEWRCLKCVTVVKMEGVGAA